MGVLCDEGNLFVLCGVGGMVSRGNFWFEYLFLVLIVAVLRGVVF